MSNAERLLQFFEYKHLPPHLQEISMEFRRVADILMNEPDNIERDTAMRKLLEVKDCAVRCRLYKGI